MVRILTKLKQGDDDDDDHDDDDDDHDDENFIWVSMYLATIANWGHYLVITNISI